MACLFWIQIVIAKTPYIVDWKYFESSEYGECSIIDKINVVKAMKAKRLDIEFKESDERNSNLKVKFVRIETKNNTLEFVPQEFFSTFPNMEVFYMAFVKLQYLDANSFNDGGKLRILFIDNNKISEISATVFKYLKNLEKIYIQKNPILFIDPSVFKYWKKIWISATDCYCVHKTLNLTDTSRHEMLDDLQGCFQAFNLKKTLTTDLQNCVKNNRLVYNYHNYNYQNMNTEMKNKVDPEDKINPQNNTVVQDEKSGDPMPMTLWLIITFQIVLFIFSAVIVFLVCNSIKKIKNFIN